MAMLFRHSPLPRALFLAQDKQSMEQTGRSILAGRVVELLPQLEGKIDREALVAYFDEFGGACATTNGPHGVICMSLELRQIDEDAWKAVLLHESGHMHNDDSWYSSRQGALLSAVASVAALYLNYGSERGWLTLGLSLLPTYLFQRGIREYATVAEPRADAFAFEHATDEQLQGAERLFIAAASAQRRIAPFKPQYVNSEGRPRQESGHGPWEERLANVRRVMAKRSIKSSDASQTLEGLVAYHVNAVCKAAGISDESQKNQVLQLAQKDAKDLFESGDLKDCSTTATHVLDGAFFGAEVATKGALACALTWSASQLSLPGKDAVALVAAAALLGSGLGALVGYKRAQNALGAA